MFEYSQAEISAQVAALPVAFQLWFNWMGLVIVLAPILFVRHRQGRVALVFSAIFIAVQMPLVRMTGLTNLLSLTHWLIWGPLLYYLCRELRGGRIARRSVFGAWAATASATIIISLVFDVRDFGRWIVGVRGVVSPAAEGLVIPWLWLGLIIASLVAAGWYVYAGALRPTPGADMQSPPP